MTESERAMLTSVQRGLRQEAYMREREEERLRAAGKPILWSPTQLRENRRVARSLERYRVLRKEAD